MPMTLAVLTYIEPSSSTVITTLAPVNVVNSVPLVRSVEYISLLTQWYSSRELNDTFEGVFAKATALLGAK